jgi:hypothetical protein
MRFRQRNGNWTDFRAEFGLTRQDEIDLHFGPRVHGEYYEAMAEVAGLVEGSLIEAQKKGRRYVMLCSFTAGQLRDRAKPRLDR